MYNNIPSERTSKRTIFVALLFCITLVSVLAAGYFAWIAKDIQTRFAQFETLEELENSKDELQAILAVEDEEVTIPVFTYPEAVQPPRRTETPEHWTLLTAMLDDWREANKDTEYCVNIRSHDSSEKTSQYSTTADQMLADEDVRNTLLLYFGVTQDEQSFFDGIDRAVDEDDRFADGYTMCSAGSRRFLLLHDVQKVPTVENYYRLASFPEVLEWSEQSSLGFSWTMYPVGEYEIMDGYRFYPDWYGNVLVQTGYGDAGYSHWEIQLLETLSGIPAIDLLEKCNVEPAEGYEDSIMTCEVRYTE